MSTEPRICVCGHPIEYHDSPRNSINGGCAGYVGLHKPDDDYSDYPCRMFRPCIPCWSKAMSEPTPESVIELARKLRPDVHPDDWAVAIWTYTGNGEKGQAILYRWSRHFEEFREVAAGTNIAALTKQIEESE